MALFRELGINKVVNKTEKNLRLPGAEGQTGVH